MKELTQNYIKDRAILPELKIEEPSLSTAPEYNPLKHSSIAPANTLPIYSEMFAVKVPEQKAEQIVEEKETPTSMTRARRLFNNMLKYFSSKEKSKVEPKGLAEVHKKDTLHSAESPPATAVNNNATTNIKPAGVEKEIQEVQDLSKILDQIIVSKRRDFRLMMEVIAKIVLKVNDITGKTALKIRQGIADDLVDITEKKKEACFSGRTYTAIGLFTQLFGAGLSFAGIAYSSLSSVSSAVSGLGNATRELDRAGQEINSATTIGEDAKKDQQELARRNFDATDEKIKSVSSEVIATTRNIFQGYHRAVQSAAG